MLPHCTMYTASSVPIHTPLSRLLTVSSPFLSLPISDLTIPLLRIINVELGVVVETLKKT